MTQCWKTLLGRMTLAGEPPVNCASFIGAEFRTVPPFAILPVVFFFNLDLWVGASPFQVYFRLSADTKEAQRHGFIIFRVSFGLVRPEIHLKGPDPNSCHTILAQQTPALKLIRDLSELSENRRKAFEFPLCVPKNVF